MHLTLPKVDQFKILIVDSRRLERLQSSLIDDALATKLNIVAPGCAKFIRRFAPISGMTRLSWLLTFPY